MVAVKKKKPTTLTQKRLKKLLHYNPETGQIRWKQTRGKQTRGKTAGCRVNNKGTVIRVDGVRHWARRLAWLYVHGEFPGEPVVHLNPNKFDNSIDNLVLKSKKPCSIPTKIPGIKQLDFEFKATIKVKNQTLTLGTFPDKISAAIARQKAEEQYGFNLDSPAYNYLKGEMPCLF